MFDLVRELGLQPWVMTTGSRGYHVTVPLRRSVDFDATRAFARDVAAPRLRREPRLCKTEQRKAKREGRILIDVMRNAYAHSAVAPYAVRARPGAPSPPRCTPTSSPSPTCVRIAGHFELCLSASSTTGIRGSGSAAVDRRSAGRGDGSRERWRSWVRRRSALRRRGPKLDHPVLRVDLGPKRRAQCPHVAQDPVGFGTRRGAREAVIQGEGRGANPADFAALQLDEPE